MKRLDLLEQRIERKPGSHDQAIAGLIDTLQELIPPPNPPQRPIGFTVPTERTTKDLNSDELAVSTASPLARMTSPSR